jgi:hypothetical protein
MNRPQRVISAAGAASATFSIDLPSSNPNARPLDRAASQIIQETSAFRTPQPAQLYLTSFLHTLTDMLTLYATTAIPDFNFKSSQRLLRLILVKGRRYASTRPFNRFRHHH